MERVDKILANMGFGTRKEVKKLVRSGAVTLNGEVIKNSDIKIDEYNDILAVFGENVEYRPYIYLMLNKPSGYVSAAVDNVYPTVVELAEGYEHYELFPVGRLDVDTEGLLILTNDGKTAHKILSPKNHIPKDYYVQTSRPVTERDTALLEQPMDLGDFITMPAQVQEADGGVIIRIYEGKFHQVKRMFEKTDNSVTYLKRIKMGGVCLDENLAPGEIRELTADELSALTGEEK